MNGRSAILAGLLISSPAILAAQQPPFEDLAVCTQCHSDLNAPPQAVDRANAWMHPRVRAAARPAPDAVGPAVLWPASMMAHSARDPYWRAKVRYETRQNPALAEVIEDTCLRCHAPMQQYEYRGTGRRMRLDDLNDIGRQGVGCTVCHQITAEGLGTKESFEANFVINPNREIYGPHANPFANPMVNFSGYTPVQANHILESALCGTCHTVITPTVNAGGDIVGEFVEQAPYLEWLVSDYPAQGRTCQSCHMPVLRDAAGSAVSMFIAHRPAGGAFPPTSPRQPFGQHFLTGGNVPMLRMLMQLYPDEAELLNANLERTQEFLADAIALELDTSRSDGELTVDVTVRNRTGHKLPSGFPSRRIWLHFRVVDAGGETVFESGAWDPATGEVAGLSGLEPHRSEITDPGQVMIYETEMKDTDGNATVTLLRAAGYLKDNRILPQGFDLNRPLPEGIEPASIAPVGTDGDPDFRPGSHEVTYRVNTAGRKGPFRVIVEALYQSVMPGHVAAMDEEGKTADEASFIDLFAKNSAPATMARAEAVAR